MQEYKRLHITPLTPSLLKTILPPSVQANSRNISYHTIQTFPEKSYGYVDLPLQDAERIKNKLHGCIIQGSKIRIQMARPIPVRDLEPALPQVERPERKKKKRKRNELPGVEIGDRRVKRGWTTPVQELKKTPGNSDKPVVKSKYTTGPECLFKTVLPPNVASNSKTIESKSKKKKRDCKEAVVHEFANTSKYATFLKDKSGSHNSRIVNKFVKGVGWIDEYGDLVEKVSKRKQTLSDIPKIKTTRLPEPSAKLKEQASKSNQLELDEESTKSLSDSETDNEDLKNHSSRSSFSSSHLNDGEKSLTEVLKSPTTPIKANDFSDVSSSSSSESEDDESAPPKVTSLLAKVPETKDRDSSDSARSLKAPCFEAENDKIEAKEQDTPFSTDPPPTSPKTPLSIQIRPGFSQHPLEALYKKSEAPSLILKPSEFKFFAAESEDISDDHYTSTDQYGVAMPLTPFTKREFEHRIIRSAAPTPDTAHINKSFIWPPRNDDNITEKDEQVIEERENDDQDSHLSTPYADVPSAASKESDFQAWFWEQRGSLNRSWKKRRKSVLKEQRQRGNRKKP
ncbi:hypothetical protein K3495_g9663 [Podosphaera aphanis]|nr:hypothetical protein K3495_g9663 [Podosphaera aphanis]